MKKYDERQHPEYIRKEDVIDFREYLAILRENWGKIFSISLGVGIVTLAIVYLIPNTYSATAVIAPVVEDQKPIPAIGALASSFGIQIGGPTRVEDLEALFKSKDLTVRVFSRNNLWPVVLQDRFDPDNGDDEGFLARTIAGTGEEGKKTRRLGRHSIAAKKCS